MTADEHAQRAAECAQIAEAMVSKVNPGQRAFSVADGARGSLANVYASLALYHQRASGA